MKKLLDDTHDAFWLGSWNFDPVSKVIGVLSSRDGPVIVHS